MYSLDGLNGGDSMGRYSGAFVCGTALDGKQLLYAGGSGIDTVPSEVCADDGMRGWISGTTSVGAAV